MKMKLFSFTATVKGTGMFPLAMLTRDQCFPATMADVARIVASQRPPTRKHTIRVRKILPKDYKHPAHTLADMVEGSMFSVLEWNRRGWTIEVEEVECVHDPDAGRGDNTNKADH